MKHQKYTELSWVKDALDYASSDKCSKEAARHIRILVGQAEIYHDGMHKRQEMIDAVKAALNIKKGRH